MAEQPTSRRSSAAKMTARTERIGPTRGEKTTDARDRRQASAEIEPLDMVDEASEESFPASDAPAWSGHAHPARDEKPTA